MLRLPAYPVTSTSSCTPACFQERVDLHSNTGRLHSRDGKEIVSAKSNSTPDDIILPSTVPIQLRQHARHVYMIYELHVSLFSSACSHCYSLNRPPFPTSALTWRNTDSKHCIFSSLRSRSMHLQDQTPFYGGGGTCPSPLHKYKSMPQQSEACNASDTLN